ncbi:tyrosine-type recombinase/integrase [Lysobacter auxotrophicus]|uniref:Site-specific integrase n=1 Tax=Lysobacter auxotrophicus TaxID=2992573 RepID=A0ABN6UKQ2_9GAMM|nr:integrase arm-type DNA-binding domain-containing protein [Lysobacter auxotrophicus]BDU16916.1 site-specific integrase [Lysobacter auxotrophicus]
MARQLNRLTVRAVQAARPGKYADGGGLFLQVTKTGVKSWTFRYTRGGIERYMGLGPTHTVGLAQARQKALEARQDLMAGRDPQQARRAAQEATAAVPTFWDAATSYIAEQKPGWANPKHASQWTSTLQAYAKPHIGTLPVDQIDTEHVLQVLRPIWASKTETATRVRQRIEAGLDALAAKKLRSAENPARWRGHLSKLLPKPTKVRSVEHFPAMPYVEAPAFMTRLRAEVGVAPRALEFLILTAARTNMVTKASRGEIEGKTWYVPAERMKNGKAFTVPLSNAALAVLTPAPPNEDAGLFPGGRAGSKHLSNGGMDKLLTRMKVDRFTVHGFRSTFRDWAAEKTHFPNEVIEMALAHTIKDKRKRHIGAAICSQNVGSSWRRGPRFLAETLSSLQTRDSEVMPAVGQHVRT